MKNKKIAGFCVAACTACGLLFLPAAETGITVQAAEVIATVQGKVMEGTTTKLLYLDTSDGKMEIKIDESTSTGNCKMLLPKKKVSVSVANGNDGYLHAVTISESGESPSVAVDTSKVSSVVGTVNAKTTEEVLHLDTAQGEMELKLDRDTDFSNCSVLVVSGKYVVRCARGDDAYMHALSVADVAAAPAGDTQTDVAAQTGAAAQASAQTPVTNVTGETRSVTGTVKESTNEYVLNLGTSEGDFTFMIDETTDTSKGMILTPENKIMVTYFRGSDNNLHASAVTGVKDSSSAVLDDSASATVTGTVKKKSTENILVLDTSAGEMELKLDKVESLSGCKALVTGKKVSVTCKRGNDAYMHALTITVIK
ncbi:MAG: hypothetical protein NC302_10485 [Bacteroidales bacterium]|nr:hypothetical protein [Bacteroidales bacterium]MCM1415360.1 hypothetical protein [bacterium]MCM1424546.1 hypothetical protein [bacterium]